MGFSLCIFNSFVQNCKDIAIMVELFHFDAQRIVENVFGGFVFQIERESVYVNLLELNVVLQLLNHSCLFFDS